MRALHAMFRAARVGGGALSLFAAALLISAADAQEPSGTAEKVSQAASAAGVTGTRVIEVQGGIFMGDSIRTDAGGEAQIRFVDDTRFVVGPNARIVIDEFVFNPNGTAQRVAVSAVKGAFRFISGASRSNAYRIRTPVMTIGVRGTGFDLFVEAGTGQSTLAVYDGAVQACDAGGQCVNVEAGCNIVVATPGGGFGDMPPASRARLLPYSVSQASLLPAFRLDTSGCQGGVPALRDQMESGSGKGSDGVGGGPRGGGSDDGGDGGSPG